jgi:MFS family permease
MSSAMMIPAALALLINTFPQGVYRQRALGIWSAVGPVGGIAGTLLGTVLADAFGWPWIFFLNVPFVLVALLIAFKLLPNSHEATSPPRVDLAGALLSTSSIVLLIAGLTQIVDPTGSSITLLALFVGSLVFLLLFCFLEKHILHPLVPLRFFLRPNIAGSSLVTLAFSAAANTPLFFFTLYMQQVHGFSSFMTGLAFLPANLAIIGGALINARLIKWLGYKHATLVSLLLIAGAVLLFTRISVTGEYIWMLLPGLVLLGSGLGIVQVVVTGVGIEQVTANERGLVSSILNMASQIGTAIGLATLVSLANLRITLLTGNTQPSSADLVASFQWAFYGGAAFALLGILMTLFTLKKADNQCL